MVELADLLTVNFNRTSGSSMNEIKTFFNRCLSQDLEVKTGVKI
jgi:hypothetical protein